MMRCAYVFVLLVGTVDAMPCPDGDCSLEDGEGLLQTQRHQHKRELGAQALGAIPESICIETFANVAESHHTEETTQENAAVNFTKTGVVQSGRRKFVPESIFQPSTLNTDDNAASNVNLPGPRDVSVAVLRKPRDNAPLSPVLNVFTMTFGQFIDHDITLVAEPNEFPDRAAVHMTLCDRPSQPSGTAGQDNCDVGCTIDRLPAVCSTESGTRLEFSKINNVHGFMEGHNVYGTSERRQAAVRLGENGLLRSQIRTENGKDFELPPYVGDVEDGIANDDQAGAPGACGAQLAGAPADRFLCGDIRCGENPALLGMHTLWLREHNRQAKRLGKEAGVPAAGLERDNWLYSHARAIVVAEIQNVLMYEWLPSILGRRRFNKLVGDYTGYNASQNPAISDAFAAAFYRFGHTLIPEEFRYRKGGQNQALTLKDSFFNIGIVREQPGILDAILRGELEQPAEDVDVFMADDVRDELFNEKQDLAARNIGRSRDHNLVPYSAMREALGFRAVTSFDDKIFGDLSNATRSALVAQYGDPTKCDVFVCMLAERKVGAQNGGQVGHLLGQVLAMEYKRMRAGDQFWFENTEMWNADFIKRIKRRNFARIFRSNIRGTIGKNLNVFKFSDFTS